MEIKNFFDLKAWKIGHKIVLEIYQTTRDFPREEVFGITNQLRRASSSITANLAEGFARYHFKDKTKFYYQARGSVAEVQNFLILSRDLKYISDDKFKELYDNLNDVGRLINGLIKSINNNS